MQIIGILTKVYYGFGGAMYQQVSKAGTEYKHWNLRGDLVATSSPTGGYSHAPLTDAFGDLVNGSRQTCERGRYILRIDA
jgi:hypothetical protein